MQCKDIPDLDVLRFLAQLGCWGTWFWFEDYKPKNSVLNAMPPKTPVKVARAKMKRLISRDLVIGCSCGCRGDYEITEKGLALISGE